MKFGVLGQRRPNSKDASFGGSYSLQVRAVCPPGGGMIGIAEAHFFVASKLARSMSSMASPPPRQARSQGSAVASFDG
jgi:hypothetical protein